MEVVRGLAAAGLTATALSPCYAGEGGRSGLLLGSGGFPERRLLEAARTLGDVLRVTARRQHAPAARELQETT